jgi:hypothetical protein
VLIGPADVDGEGRAMAELSAPLDLLARADPRLQDPAALEEIELYAELMIAAGASRRALTRAEIDDVLGVRRAATGRAEAS